MTPIPRLIHQIRFNNYEIPEENKNIRKLNPNWGYTLWTDTAALELILTQVPEYYNYYKKLNFLEKSDFFRYVLMYLYGGVYADLDVEFHKSLDSFFEYNKIFYRDVRGTDTLPEEGLVENLNLSSYDIILSGENYVFGDYTFVNNYFLMSSAKNPFWKTLLDVISLNSQGNVYEKTGFAIFTNVLKESNPKNTLVLPSFYFGWGDYMKTPRPSWVIASHNTNKTSKPKIKKAKKYNVLFFSPAMLMGGAERWICSLSYDAPLDKVDIKGVLVEDLHSSELLQEYERRYNVYSTKMTNLEELLSDVDILIMWGNMTYYKEFNEFKGIKLAISHATTNLEYSRHMLDCMLRYDGIHLGAVSDKSAEGWNRPDVKVIYNGIDVSRCAPTIDRTELKTKLNIPKFKKVVLNVARNSPEKRPELFDRIIGRLNAKEDNYIGLWMGPNYNSNIPHLKSYKNIKFIEPDTEVGNYYNIADVFLLTSIDEAFCFSLAEAWYNMIPTVCTSRIPTIKELKKLHHINFSTTVENDDILDEWVAAIKNPISYRDMFTIHNIVKRNYNSKKMAHDWINHAISLHQNKFGNK